jgi:hypothetical protein
MIKGGECLVLCRVSGSRKQIQQIEFSENRLLRPVAGYRRNDKKINTDIRRELNTSNLGQKIK